MPKRKPTRRDLLVVIGRLQYLVGSIKGAANDRNPNSAAQVEAIVDRAMIICISSRSHDDAVEPSGPWADLAGEDHDWEREA